MSPIPQKHANEKWVKGRIKHSLDAPGWFWWSPPANGFGTTGISDIHAVRTSVFMVIEAKYGTNKPTAQQIGFLNSIRAEGHFAFCVNEKNVERFEDFLIIFDTASKMVQAGQQVPANVGGPMLDLIKALTTMIPMTL